MEKRSYIFKFLFFSLSLAAVLCLGIPSFAQTNKNIENKKAEIEKLNKDIEFLDRQIEQTNRKRRNTLTELSLYQKKAQTRKKLIDRLDAEIKEQDNEITNRTELLRKMRRQLDTLKSDYSRMIKKAYVNRDNRTWFMYILASDNIEQGYRRYSYLKNYSKALNGEGVKIKEAQAKIEKEMAAISDLKDSNIKSQKAHTEEYNKLQKEGRKSKELANRLDRQQKQLNTQLKEKRKQSARLNQEVERLIAAAIAAEKKKAEKQGNTGKTTAYDGKSYVATPQSLKLSSAFEGNKGRLPWPVKRGFITEKFGVNKHPTLKNVNMPFNNGINISAPRGCQVFSVFDGVVKQILFIPGYHNCVLVSHGTYFTFYCRLGKVSVKTGQKVSTGQVLGTLDSSDESSELHFELWNGMQKQNPESWLKSN